MPVIGSAIAEETRSHSIKGIPAVSLTKETVRMFGVLFLEQLKHDFTDRTV